MLIFGAELSKANRKAMTGLLTVMVGSMICKKYQKEQYYEKVF